MAETPVLALVDRLADVGAVVQHPVEVLLVDPVAAGRADAAFRYLPRQFGPRPDLEDASGAPTLVDLGTGFGARQGEKGL